MFEDRCHGFVNRPGSTHLGNDFEMPQFGDDSLFELSFLRQGLLYSPAAKQGVLPFAKHGIFHLCIVRGVLLFAQGHMCGASARVSFMFANIAPSCIAVAERPINRILTGRTRRYYP